MDSVKAFVRTCCFLLIVSGVIFWAWVVSGSDTIPKFIVDHKSNFILGIIHDNWHDPIPLIGCTLMLIGIFWGCGEGMIRPFLSFFGVWVVKPLQDWIGQDSELYRYHILRNTANFSRWYELIKKYFLPGLLLYFILVWLVLHIAFSPIPFQKFDPWQFEVAQALLVGWMVLMVPILLRMLFNHHYSRNPFRRYKEYQIYAKFIGEYAPKRSRLEIRATLGRLGFERYKPAIKELEEFHANEKIEQARFKKEFEGWKTQQAATKKLESSNKK